MIYATGKNMGKIIKKRTERRTSLSKPRGKSRTASAAIVAKNPWKKHRGLHKDEPLFDTVLAEIAELRRQENHQAVVE